MSFQTHYEFLFIGKEDDGFARNYFYQGGDDQASRKDQLFITFQMPNHSVLAEEIGETIFGSLRQRFFSDNRKDAYVRFESALKETNQVLKHLQEKKEFKFIPNLNVMVAVVSGQELYLTQAGEAEGYLIRRKHVSVISEGLTEEEGQQDLFTNIASGSLEAGDSVVFTSARLLRYMTEIDLGKIFSTYGASEALKELKQLLSREVVERTAVLAIDVRRFDEEKIIRPPIESGVLEKKWFRAGLERVRLFRHYVIDAGRRMRQSARVDLSKFRRPPRSMKKNKLFMGLLALVVVLGGSVYFIRKNTYETKKLQEYTLVLQDVREILNRSSTTAHYAKPQAGELLAQAEAKAITVSQSGFLRGEVNTLLKEITVQRDQLDVITRIPAGQEKVLVDLSTKRSDVSALGLLHLKENLYAYEYNALYQIVLNTVAEPFTIDANEVVTTATGFDDQDSLVFFTKTNRMIEFKDGHFTFMDTDDSAWHTGVSLGTFSNRLYVLDPTSNQIWKYIRRRDRYSGAEAYSTKADLSKAVTMTIDGAVYILNNDGSIQELYRGEGRDYTVKDSPLTPISKASRLYTEAEMDQLYVLEADSQRVIVFNKENNTGNLFYARQYIFEGLNDLRDLYVDKLSQKLYVLDKSKIYEVGL